MHLENASNLMYRCLQLRHLSSRLLLLADTLHIRCSIFKKVFNGLHPILDVLVDVRVVDVVHGIYTLKL